MKKISRFVICMFMIVTLISLVGCSELGLQDAKENSNESVSENSEVESEGSETSETTNIVQAKSNVRDDVLVSMTYNFGNYDISSWRITDSKEMTISVVLESAPKGAEVVLKKVEIENILVSENSKLDGLCQESDEDVYESEEQEGFSIPYEFVFKIAGSSDILTEKWEKWFEKTGFLNLTKLELNDINLIKHGEVTANQIDVVYTFMIKYEGKDKYYEEEIEHNINVPLSYSEAK